jgi:hypothetical protein
MAIHSAVGGIRGAVRADDARARASAVAAAPSPSADAPCAASPRRHESVRGRRLAAASALVIALAALVSPSAGACDVCVCGLICVAV